MKPKTSTLGPAGRKLKAWIEGQFSTDGVEPMVEHVCELADLQAALKADIQKRGVVLSDGSRNPSTDATLKASAAFARAWRILGLADAEKPPVAAKRR